MEKRKKLLTTSVAQKFISALTGLFLCAFLVTHLLGNLSIFPGKGEYINAYANFLGGLPITLFLEIGLVVLILAHAFIGLKIYRQNKLARPQEYAVRKWTKDGKITSGPHKSRKSVSSTTMAISGTLTLVFIILHIIHFRFGKYRYEMPASPTGAVATMTQGATTQGATTQSGTQTAAPNQFKPAGGEDLARLINESFGNIFIVGLYVLSLVLLAFHLNHGFASAFQSVGVGGYTNVWMWAGRLFTAVVIGGFISIPLYIYFFRR